MKKYIIAAATLVTLAFFAGCGAQQQLAQPAADSKQPTNIAIQTADATGEVRSFTLDAQASPEKEKQQKEDLATLQTAMGKGDISDCSKVEDVNWRNDCIFNITVRKVNETGEKTLCDAIEDPMRRQFCTGEFAQSLAQ